MSPNVRRLVVVLLALAASVAFGAEGEHHDPSASVVLSLALILVSAKLGGDVAIRLGQPSVLGELVVGVVLGNLSHLGGSWFEPLEHDAFLDMFARLGVIVLLFEVGLESTVAQMLQVGAAAVRVAVLGVVTPMLLGVLVVRWLLPDQAWVVALFVGATLSATSVGITARVLKDLGQQQRPESRIILGAAVIDDVLGLVLLAMVVGMVHAADSGVSLSGAALLMPLVKAAGFLFGALLLGRWLSPRLFRLASLLKARMVLLAAGLSFCFVLAWLSDLIGLAPIVGAFAAGLILEDVHFKDFDDSEPKSLETLVHPISSFLVPVFFVLMGMRTELAAFVTPGVPLLALVLCVVAIVGKLAAGWGAGAGARRLMVGVGMIPRGEVGLIFAGLGAQLMLNGQPVISPRVFSALVVVVIVTTFVTPPWLRRLTAR